MFCLGLRNVFDAQPHAGEDTIDPHSLSTALKYNAEPIIDLIRRVMLKREPTKTRAGHFSLNVRPVAELLDSFHDREASDNRDKLFVLLGMSSDGHIPSNLLPNYEADWSQLFAHLVHFLFGSSASVKTAPDTEVAVIQAKGWVLGTWEKMKHPYSNTAGYMMDDDVVCQFQEASGLALIRPHRDYWIVVSVGVNVGENSRAEQPGSSLCNFLLVWDWERKPEGLEVETEKKGIGEKYYRGLMTTTPDVTPRDATSKPASLFKIERIKAYLLVDMALAKACLDEKDTAGEPFDQIRRDSEAPLLLATERSVEVAEFLLHQHSAELKVTAPVLEAAAMLDDRDSTSWGGFSITAVVRTWGFLRSHLHITERVLAAAAQNELHGPKMVRILLEHKHAGCQVKATEVVVTAAVGNRIWGDCLVQLLYEKRPLEVILGIAAGNQGRRWEEGD
ncbi:hypothetical protein B0T25DRAFT_618214 [Lasiosphaeria hispida]|uniref:Uncharacterized protein n=1 Tax=Lasiosphaeria hispida TaxID=260671 RepID=A0AAJ0H518_9PEZI|nr:hypothetical protein B0T25DRAFT_618214 [Lasiosphaeria hispida]